jgi:hypothetical protein
VTSLSGNAANQCQRSYHQCVSAGDSSGQHQPGVSASLPVCLYPSCGSSLAIWRNISMQHQLAASSLCSYAGQPLQRFWRLSPIRKLAENTGGSLQPHALKY